MRSVLGDHNLLDFAAALKAALAAPTIDEQLFLEAPTLPITIDVIAHRSSAKMDSLLQDGLDRPKKPFILIQAKRRHSSQGMDAGFKESFIRIDVTDARYKTLIQQQ